MLLDLIQQVRLFSILDEMVTSLDSFFRFEGIILFDIFEYKTSNNLVLDLSFL